MLTGKLTGKRNGKTAVVGWCRLSGMGWPLATRWSNTPLMVVVAKDLGSGVENIAGVEMSMVEGWLTSSGGGDGVVGSGGEGCLVYFCP